MATNVAPTKNRMPLIAVSIACQHASYPAHLSRCYKDQCSGQTVAEMQDHVRLLRSGTLQGHLRSIELGGESRSPPLYRLVGNLSKLSNPTECTASPADPPDSQDWGLLSYSQQLHRPHGPASYCEESVEVACPEGSKCPALEVRCSATPPGRCKQVDSPPHTQTDSTPHPTQSDPPAYTAPSPAHQSGSSCNGAPSPYQSTAPDTAG